MQFVYEHTYLNDVWHMNIPEGILTGRELGVTQIKDLPSEVSVPCPTG